MIGIPFGVCDLVDGKMPNKCYRLKKKLHVGEQVRFELMAGSVISEDRVDIQGAVEPGIPIGIYIYICIFVIYTYIYMYI